MDPNGVVGNAPNAYENGRDGMVGNELEDKDESTIYDVNSNSSDEDLDRDANSLDHAFASFGLRGGQYDFNAFQQDQEKDEKEAEVEPNTNHVKKDGAILNDQPSHVRVLKPEEQVQHPFMKQKTIKFVQVDDAVKNEMMEKAKVIQAQLQVKLREKIKDLFQQKR